MSSGKNSQSDLLLMLSSSCQDGKQQSMWKMGLSFFCRTNICITRSATAASTAARARGGSSWTRATLRPWASSGCSRGPTPPCWSTSIRATTEAPRPGRIPQRSRSNKNLSAGHQCWFSLISVCLHQKEQKDLISVNWIHVFATQVRGSERRMCWFKGVPPCATRVIRHTASFWIQWSSVSCVFRKTGNRTWTLGLWEVKTRIIILDSVLLQGGGACPSQGNPKTKQHSWKRNLSRPL